MLQQKLYIAHKPCSITKTSYAFVVLLFDIWLLKIVMNTAHLKIGLADIIIMKIHSQMQSLDLHCRFYSCSSPLKELI